MSRETNIGSVITRFWLSAAILLTVIAALVLPGPALVLPRFHVIDIGVVIIMFMGSLKLTPRCFKEAASRSPLVALSVVSVFGLAPLISLGIGSLVGFTSDADRLGILICSAQATTLATAIVLTEVAGGDVALAMVMTVVNNLSAVLLTPLVFRVLGGTVIRVDYLAMTLEMTLTVASQLIILIYIYCGVGAGIDRLAGGVGILLHVIVLVILFHAALLLVNAIIGRILTPLPGSRVAFILCSSQKTLPIAILLWKSYFPALPLGPLVAAAYHIVQLTTDSILAPGALKLPLVRRL